MYVNLNQNCVLISGTVIAMFEVQHNTSNNVVHHFFNQGKAEGEGSSNGLTNSSKEALCCSPR